MSAHYSKPLARLGKCDSNVVHENDQETQTPVVGAPAASGATGQTRDRGGVLARGSRSHCPRGHRDLHCGRLSAAATYSRFGVRLAFSVLQVHGSPCRHFAHVLCNCLRSSIGDGLAQRHRGLPGTTCSALPLYGARGAPYRGFCLTISHAAAEASVSARAETISRFPENRVGRSSSIDRRTQTEMRNCTTRKWRLFQARA